MNIVTVKRMEKEYGSGWRERFAGCLEENQPRDGRHVAITNGCEGFRSAHQPAALTPPAANIPRAQVAPAFGLGDLVAAVANPIAKAINKVAGTNLGSDAEECGCKKRKEALNRLVPDITRPLSGQGILPP